MTSPLKSVEFLSKSDLFLQPTSNEIRLMVKCRVTPSYSFNSSPFLNNPEKRICKRTSFLHQKRNLPSFSAPSIYNTKKEKCQNVSATSEWNDQQSSNASNHASRESIDSGIIKIMYGEDIPTQGEAVVAGVKSAVISEFKPLDLDYLQELLAIQQSGSKAIGFFGTRNMGFMHQQLIEILSYAMVITNNHIYTSGASGTNAAVIRGALRGEKPDLLTVILPQSLSKQPPESQELLEKVANVIEKPHNDCLPLLEASRLCNLDILSNVEQVICFAFHDSKLLMETCREAKEMRKIVTLFYLD